MHLVRPGHDSWGVNKIVFHFCDDFLLKTYEYVTCVPSLLHSTVTRFWPSSFPFSQEEEWRKLLSPIYAAVGQVSLSLLGLPP